MSDDDPYSTNKNPNKSSYIKKELIDNIFDIEPDHDEKNKAIKTADGASGNAILAKSRRNISDYEPT